MKFFFFCFLVLGFFSKKKEKANPVIESIPQDSCHFTTSGRNTYFVLEPGFQLVLEGKEGKNKGKLVITVLHETKMIGNTETRVVEENESVNGKTVEISRNFFAYCRESGSIHYFGEDVDIYKNNKIVSHEGAWLAEGKNKPGVLMPGLVKTGTGFYQEMAPGIAMDQMKIISLTENLQTPAGNFSKVLKSEESSPLEPGTKEYKFYAPGIGLIKEQHLLLVKYGFVK